MAGVDDVIVTALTAVVTLILGALAMIQKSKEIPAKVRNSKRHIPWVVNWLKINQKYVTIANRYTSTHKRWKNPIKWDRRRRFVAWQKADTWRGHRAISPFRHGRPHPYHLVGWPEDKCLEYLRQRWTLLALMEPIVGAWNMTTADKSDWVENISQDETTDQALLDLIFPPKPRLGLNAAGQPDGTVWMDKSEWGRWPPGVQDSYWGAVSQLYALGTIPGNTIVPFAAFGFTERDVRKHNLRPAKHRLFTVQVLSRIMDLLSAGTLAGSQQLHGMMTLPELAAAAAEERPVYLPELKTLLIALAQDPDPIVALARYHEVAPPEAAAMPKPSPEQMLANFHQKMGNLAPQIRQELAHSAMDLEGTYAPKDNYLPLYFAAGIWSFVGLIRPRL